MLIEVAPLKAKEFGFQNLYLFAVDATIPEYYERLGWKKICGTVTKSVALDIACGTGRITTTLAEIGLKCTGIDRSDPMLGLVKEKAKHDGFDIVYLNVDMRDFNLNKKFDL